MDCDSADASASLVDHPIIMQLDNQAKLNITAMTVWLLLANLADDVQDPQKRVQVRRLTKILKERLDALYGEDSDASSRL